MLRKLVLPLLLLLGLVAFLPGIDGPFLLDDEFNLMRARAPSGTTADMADALLRNSTGDLRRPISNASFLANYHLLGTSPLAYKAVNLAIHFLNGLLVFLLCRTLARALMEGPRARAANAIALFAGLLWLVHPLQVSTVLYVVQRMAQLSALFVFLGLLWGLRALNPSRIGSDVRQAVSAACFLGITALAVLSKENGALLPLFMLAVWFCMRKPDSPALRRGQLVFVSIACLLPLAAGGLIFALKLPGWLEAYNAREFTAMERLLTQPVVLLHYLSTLLIPRIDRMGLYLDDFTIRTTADPIGWLALAAWLAAIGWAVLKRRQYPVPALAILWFAAGHAMESTILPLEIAFEHRNHVAILGPLFAISAGIVPVLQERLGGRSATLLLVIPLLVLAGLTARRAHHWSSIDLFTWAEVAHHPESPRAQTTAAAKEASMGRLDAALARIRIAQQLRPNSFWMKSYDIHLACAGMKLDIDWQGLVVQARVRPQEIGIDEALRPAARRLFQGTCAHVDALEFEELVIKLIPVMRDANRPSQVERLLIIRSLLAEKRGDIVKAHKLLRAGAEENPAGLESLTLLAYDLLNRGDLDEAERASREIAERIRQYHRGTQQFEAKELADHITDARNRPRGTQ